MEVYDGGRIVDNTFNKDTWLRFTEKKENIDFFLYIMFPYYKPL